MAAGSKLRADGSMQPGACWYTGAAAPVRADDAARWRRRDVAEAHEPSSNVADGL